MQSVRTTDLAMTRNAVLTAAIGWVDLKTQHCEQAGRSHGTSMATEGSPAVHRAGRVKGVATTELRVGL